MAEEIYGPQNEPSVEETPTDQFDTTEDFDEGGATEEELLALEAELFASETEEDVVKYLDIPGLTGAASFGKIDAATGNVGIEVPDFDLSGGKFEDTDDGDDKTSVKESLKRTWNNSLDQLSLVDDRFYWLSEYLFGDVQSTNFQDSEAAITESEENSEATIGFTDVDDIYAEEGFIGALGGVAAATINAASAFATSAVESVATGGAALGVDMVSASVRDYNKAKADKLGISIEELIETGQAETFIPVGLGSLAYSFERYGIKGVGKAIKGLAPGAKKALVAIANSAGKEGGTEFAQSLVETFNTGLGKSGNSIDAAVEDVGEFIREDGLETFLQGAVGGGVSAGGGRAIRRAKSQLRSKAAEEAIADKSKDVLELDKKLNNPNVPQEQKDTMQRARKDLIKDIKSAVKEPNTTVNRLHDQAIADINKRGDNIKELRKELKEAEGLGEDVNGIVRRNINDRVQKEINGINKILENRSDKPIRDDEGNLIEQEEANSTLLKEFEKGEITDDAAFGAAVAYENLAKKTASRFWQENNVSPEQGYTKADFTRDLMVGDPDAPSNSLYGLAKGYNPEIGSFGGYAKKFLPERAKALLEKHIGKQVKGFAPEDEGGYGGTTTQDPLPPRAVKVKKIGLALDFKPETIKTIENKVTKAIGNDKLNVGTKQSFDKALGQKAKETVWDAVADELGKDTKANPQFTRNLIKHHKTLFNLIPRKSLINASNGIKKYQSEAEKGQPNIYDQWLDLKDQGQVPTQQAFANQFRALDATPSARRNMKRNIINWVSQGLFNEAAADALQYTEGLAEKFEIVNEIGKNPKDAISSVGAARIQMIAKTPITNNRIKPNLKGKGQIVKSTKSIVQNLTDTMSQAWNKNKRVSVYATTDRTAAIGALLDAGYKTEQEASDYLEEIDGFTFVDSRGTRFIYNAKDSSLDTPVHEFGHVWSAFLQDNNPVLWKEGVKVLLKDPIKRNYQLDRLKGNYSGNKNWSDALKRLSKEGITDAEIDDIINRSDRDTRQVLDEILAGEIGDKGAARTNKAQFNVITGTEYNWQKILDSIWDYIGTVLANVKGKEIRDLTANQFLDLAVSDVMNGTPGAAFAEMNIPVGSNQFENIQEQARAELKEKRKEEPEAISDQAKYDGLSAFRNALSQGKSVSQALDLGETATKGELTKAQWYKTVKNSLNQGVIDEAGLQEAFLMSDDISQSNDRIWEDIVYGKNSGKRLPKLLASRADTNKVSAAENEAKWDFNFDFFKKHEEAYTQHIPKEFWDMMVKRKKRGDQEVSKDSFLRAEDAAYFSKNAKYVGGVWNNGDSIEGISRQKSVKALKSYASNEANTKRVDENQDVIFKIGDFIQKLAEAGVPKEDLAVLLKSFSNTGNSETNFFRKGARLAGYSANFDALTADKQSNFVPEHNPPAGYIALTLLDYATKQKWNDGIKKAVADKYKYFALDRADDPGIKGQGDSTFKSGMTKGFNLLVDDPIIRYVATGGNVQNIKNMDGSYVAEQFGFTRKFLNDANYTDSKAYAQAIENATVSQIKPTQQQLISTIDETLGQLDVLIAEGKERERLQKSIEDAARQLRQENKPWNDIIDELSKSARTAFGNSYDGNKKEVERTYLNKYEGGDRRFTGKDGLRKLVDILDKDQQNWEQAKPKSWDLIKESAGLLGMSAAIWGGGMAAIVGAGYVATGGLEAGLEGATIGAGIGAAGAALLAGSFAITNYKSKVKQDKLTNKALEDFAKAKKALDAKPVIQEKRKKQVNSLQKTVEETFGLRDAQFKEMIRYAKKIGAYLDGDEDLQLRDMHRVVNRIKKAEKARAAKPEVSEKLAIFDFDDTLYKTNNVVLMTHADGSQTIVDSEKFANYKWKEGDKADFTDFNNVTNPKGLPDLAKVGEALKAGSDVTILTARPPGAGDPVMKLLRKRFGAKANNIKFKGVEHGSPKAKANYVKNAIAKYGYKEVFFMDDAMPNVLAVDAVIKASGAEGGAEVSTFKKQELAKEVAKNKKEYDRLSKINKVAAEKFYNKMIKDNELAERKAKREAIAEEKRLVREAAQKLRELANEKKLQERLWKKIQQERESNFVDALLSSKGKNVGDPSAELARRKGTDQDTWKIPGISARFQKLRFFMPPNAEDFKGLLYTLLPKGKEGEKQWQLITNKLLKPFANASAAVASKKVNSFNQLKKAITAFKKNNPDIKLDAKLTGSKITYEQAVRFAMHNIQDPSFRDKLSPSGRRDLDIALAVVGKNPNLTNLAQELYNDFGGLNKFKPDNFWAGNFKTDLIDYINKDYRKEVLQPWTDNVNRIFNTDNLNKFEAAYGTKWRIAVEDSIKRMKSGRNRSYSNNQTVNRFQDWINNSVATTMMLNFRSGFLQMLSAFNFINAPGNNIFKAGAAFANQPQYWRDVVDLMNSDFLKNRRGGQAWDISADEISQIAHGKNSFQKALAKMFEIGFLPTQMMDSMAIAVGGASWYRNAINDGMSHEDAMLTFQEIAEESQQSSRTDKISSLQASSLGRIIFAFANTPLQYARLTKRAFQDIRDGRGNQGNNWSKLMWYGGVQGVIFAGIQNAVLAGLADDDDEDWKNNKTDKNLWYAAESYITSWLKGWGFPGAAAGTLLSTVKEIENQQVGALGGKKRADAPKIAEKLLSISPTISVKFRDIVKSYRSWTYKQEKEKMKYLPVWHKENPFLESIFTGLTAVTNVSAPEVALSIIDRIRDINDEQVGLIQGAAIAAGWNKEYQLGIEPSRRDELDLRLDLKKGRVDFIKSGGRKQEILDRRDARKKEIEEVREKRAREARSRRRNSPIEREEAGQTFSDGTIQVDPNLSPVEREKTIAHEQEHVRQMQEEGLDYDDNNVYFRGKRHKRKNGKIRYNGKWTPEGDKSFPWEAHAYEAESPIARSGDKDKKKEDEKYIRNPEHIEQVNKSRDRFEQHYSDPVTEELYRQNTGFNDLPSKVDTALNTRIQTGFVPQGAKATYDPAIGDYKGAITVEDYRDPAVVDHELTHAAGFDEALGKEAQKILGKPKSGNKYLSKPAEVYGNLHEFRARLDLKGFERNLSPKKVKDLIKFNELENDPDIKQMIDEFGLDKLSEALNKIASNKEKPTLEGLYG